MNIGANVFLCLYEELSCGDFTDQNMKTQ